MLCIPVRRGYQSKVHESDVLAQLISRMRLKRKALYRTRYALREEVRLICFGLGKYHCRFARLSNRDLSLA